jgi:hypothetical protein
MSEDLKIVEVTLVDEGLYPLEITEPAPEPPKDFYHAIFGAFPEDVMIVAGGSNYESVVAVAEDWVASSARFWAMAKNRDLETCHLIVCLQLKQAGFTTTPPSPIHSSVSNQSEQSL